MFFTMLDSLSILSRVRNYYKEAFTGEIFSKTSVLTHVLRKGLILFEKWNQRKKLIQKVVSLQSLLCYNIEIYS